MSKKKGIAKAPTEGLVLDCSIVMAWFFADESSDYADLVARQLPERRAFVPSNWPLEVANTLLVGERRKRSTQAQAAKLRVDRWTVVFGGKAGFACPQAKFVALYSADSSR